MKMKAKFLTAITVTILLASMVSIVFVPSATGHTECNPAKTDLIAGQHTDVGDVLVWNDINYLYVKYVTTDDWYLTEVHLHIATSMEDIPQMNGNPIPGHFEYVEEGLWTQEYLFEVPLAWNPCTDVEIAAHAVVQRIVETCIDFESFQEKDDVSSVSTPKGTVNFYMTSKAPLVPLVVGDTASLPSAGSYPMVAAPDTSPPYENIVAFTVVYPGNPYRDDYVKDDGGTGAGGKTLTDPQDLSQTPLLYHAYAQGLAIVIDVSDVEAVQGLDLAAIDLDWTEVWYFLYFDEDGELMDKTELGPPVGQSGDGVAYAVEYPNPVSKVAIWGGMNLGQEDRIGYAIDNICVASLEEETAWGAGCDFPGNNWATYFTYTVQGLVDTFTVSATTSTPTQSNVVLEAGKLYKIEAVGTYYFRTYENPQGYLADAEYALRNDDYGTGWTKGDAPPYSEPYNGLDLCSDAGTNTDWGPLDTATHTYSILYTGTGSTISLFIKDNVYGDNSGSLTVNIYCVGQ
jgi:hypothetical protein